MIRIRLALSVMALAAGCAWAGAGDVRRQSGQRWENASVRLLFEVPGFSRSEPARLDQYGGSADRRAKATGFFRTEKIQGRWWLVDPEGGLFLSAGINSVNLVQSKGELEPTGCNSTSVWATAAARLLLTNRFNTLGCWSTVMPSAASNSLPYTSASQFMVAFGTNLGLASPDFGHWAFPKDCIPVFHPGFEAFCDQYARRLQATREDPWLLGHFSDNELPFRPDSLDRYLSLPKDDPGHRAAQAWWDERCRSGGQKQIEDKDRQAFLQFLAERYYGVVGAAIRKHDPNHLYLGSRLHGKAISEPVLRGSAALDVVSVNYYNAWTPDLTRMREWSEWSGHPVLISEFYAMRIAAPDKDTRGAGFRVPSHAERGLFYQHFVLGALESPVCVGWHWFKYGGDNEAGRNGAEIGVVDTHYQPRAELFSPMRELNAQLYPLAEHFSARQSAK
jgi:hypothetical protein